MLAFALVDLEAALFAQKFVAAAARLGRLAAPQALADNLATLAAQLTLWTENREIN